MSNKLAGEIELLFDSIASEKREKGETVGVKNVMSELMMYKDIDRRPKIVVRKIVERLVTEHAEKVRQQEETKISEEKAGE